MGVTAAQMLLQQGEIERHTCQRMALYWAFSKLIANSDMHQGNLSFLRPEQHPVAMAPLYDMLPMAFAPSGNGNMRREAVAIRLSHEVSGTIWRQAELLALEFWRRTALCPQISDEFRTIAAQMLAQLQKLNFHIARLARLSASSLLPAAVTVHRLPPYRLPPTVYWRLAGMATAASGCVGVAAGCAPE